MNHRNWVFPQLILFSSFHYPIRNAIWNSTSGVTLSQQNATHCGWGQPHIDLSKENSVKSWWSKQVQIRIPMKRCSSSLRLKLVKEWVAKSPKNLFTYADMSHISWWMLLCLISLITVLFDFIFIIKEMLNWCSRGNKQFPIFDPPTSYGQPHWPQNLMHQKHIYQFLTRKYVRHNQW